MARRLIPSDRTCATCGSDRTYGQNGHKNWYKSDDGWLCEKCYMKSPKWKSYKKSYQKSYWKSYMKSPKRIAYLKSLKWKFLKKSYKKSPIGIAIKKRNAAMRRGRLAAKNATLTAEEWEQNLSLGYCVLCQGPFTKSNPATQEHMISLNRGGPHSQANVWPTHLKSCNLSKNNSPIASCVKTGNLIIVDWGRDNVGVNLNELVFRLVVRL